MYQLDILKNNEWQTVLEHEDIQEIDKVVHKLTLLRPNKYMRVLQNNIVLVFLNGTDYQYLYWKNTYVRERSKNYDHGKNYEKELSRKGKPKKQK